MSLPPADAAASTAQPSNTPNRTPQSGPLTVVATRGGDGLGVSVKVEGTGRVFRIEPARDPNQPRFWCFRVYRCTSAGVVSQADGSWWGAGGMSRAELPAAVSAIRTDPNAWIAGRERAELRGWILESSEA